MATELMDKVFLTLINPFVLKFLKAIFSDKVIIFFLKCVMAVVFFLIFNVISCFFDH